MQALSQPDEQNELTHIVDAGNDEAYEASDSSRTELSDFGFSSMHARLYAFYPDRKKLSSSQTIGKVVLNKELTLKRLVTILCDTGALSANYVAKDLIDKLRKKISNEAFFETRHKVILADSRTVQNIQKGVKLNLILKDHNAHTYKYTGEFFILDMKSNDIILGLPALTGKLYPFMDALLRDAHKKNKESAANSTSHSGNTEDLNLLQDCRALEDFRSELCTVDRTQPWTKSNDTLAPEDEETELPVQFKDALTFLGKSREEAIKDYLDMLESHVSEEFRNSTYILNLLKTKALPVFVPDEWSGIKGVEPLELKWKDTLPDRMKPKARPINPKLWEASEKEFHRLCGYFYGKSRSPWASCLVVAPKATPPYIRFCGDYVQLNKHMEVGNFTIPNVRHELQKIINFPIYLDIDLTNAFHQIPLADKTRDKLSIQTPWGQFAPNFMPEGIAPATGVLQEVVKEIFSEFSDWAIVIFDNMLILAEDFQDAYRKFEIIIDKCIERNVKLKMAKSWLGFSEVNFFGYVCRHKSYQVSPDKKEALANIPMPTSTKLARSLLGKGVFFSGFTPRYSDLVAHLTDMTKKSFNWDKSTWRHDYEAEFDAFIKGLQDACELYYPDYSLDWILRTDASEIGVGAVLLQLKTLEDDTTQLQPIAFVSKKFSEQAQRWATIEQEAYGIYYAVKQLAYYLVGKEFVIETDHNNLVWMEASMVPKIMRWRIYLQSFNFEIRHIPGSKNWLADWLSREFKATHLSGIFPDVQHDDSNSESDTEDGAAHYLGNFMNPDERNDQIPKKKYISKEECLRQVHNSRVGHMGGRTTWTRLNKQFPGHCIPYKEVAEFISTCPNCIKTRLGMKDALVPLVRNLKPPSSRSVIGIDAVQITPPGKDGHTHINVVINLYTKLVFLEPVKGVTALNLANTIWKYWSFFGHTDLVISDKGPDLNSQLFEQLIEYMGMRHTFSIADKHANGCERVIGEVVRHLRALVYDNSERTERKDVFEDPSWIPTVQYILNSEISSETGFTPFELTFGSAAALYAKLGQGGLPSNSHARLDHLNSNLEALQKSSKAYQDNLKKERAARGVLPDEQNLYQPGDLILFDKGAKVHPKMSHRYAGPCKVKVQYKNDIDCQHLVTGQVVRVDVQDVKLYPGNEETAYQMALRDHDQHEIDSILFYHGDRERRSTMIFTIRFKDGDVREVPYSQDLFDSIPYEEFCTKKPYLYHLIFPVDRAKTYIAEKRNQPITDYKPGDEVYVNLRVFGDVWYEALELPDSHILTYVAQYQFTHWYHKNSHRVLSIKNVLTHKTFRFDNYHVHCFVHREFDASTMILLDEDMVAKYPQVNQDI